MIVLGDVHVGESIAVVGEVASLGGELAGLVVVVAVALFDFVAIAGSGERGLPSVFLVFGKRGSDIRGKLL